MATTRDSWNRLTWWQKLLVVGAGCIAGCLYLFVSLPVSTQMNFFIWNAAGLVLYLLFARRNTNLAKGEELPG